MVVLRLYRINSFKEMFWKIEIFMSVRFRGRRILWFDKKYMIMLILAFAHTYKFKFRLSRKNYVIFPRKTVLKTWRPLKPNKNLSWKVRITWCASNIELFSGCIATWVAPKVSEFYSADATSPNFHIRFHKQNAYRRYSQQDRISANCVFSRMK